MSSGLRWGVLGAAGIAAVVVDANRGSDVTRFTAVASRDLPRTMAFADQHGIEHSFGSYDELLAGDVVDAVYIALPNSLHATWALAALRAGKHVLCEKPFAISPDDAQLCADAAVLAGKRCAEGFMWRFHPQTVLVQQLIADGAIGDVSTVRAALTITAPAGDIRYDPALGGGALYDLGGYCISAIRLFGGTPETVGATAVFDPNGIDRRMTGTVRTRSGVLGTFDIALDLIRRDELTVVGTRGAITITDPWLCRSTAVELSDADGLREVAVPGATDGDEGAVYRVEFDRVSAAFADHTELPFEMYDATEQAAVLGAVMESARTEKLVAVDVAVGAPIEVTAGTGG